VSSADIKILKRIKSTLSRSSQLVARFLLEPLIARATNYISYGKNKYNFIFKIQNKL